MIALLRFVGLLSGVVLFVYIAALAFDAQIIPWLLQIQLFLLGIWKTVKSKQFWQSVPLVLGKWSLTTILKTVFVRWPMWVIMLIIPIIIGPKRRRRLRVRIGRAKQFGFRLATGFRDWCKQYYGLYGTIAFFVSLVSAVIFFIVTTTYIGWTLVFWLGSWGPLGTVFTWIKHQFVRTLYGMLHSVPGMRGLLNRVAAVWFRLAGKHLPKLVAKQRLAVKQTMRHAFKAGQLTESKLDRVDAWRARQRELRAQELERRKELRRQAKRRLKDRREKARKRQTEAYLKRFAWTSAMRPLWERRFWRPDTIARMFADAPREKAERVYLRQILGADVHQGLLQGGHTHWRVTRRR